MSLLFISLNNSVIIMNKPLGSAVLDIEMYSQRGDEAACLSTLDTGRGEEALCLSNSRRRKEGLLSRKLPCGKQDVHLHEKEPCWVSVKPVILSPSVRLYGERFPVERQCVERHYIEIFFVKNT